MQAIAERLDKPREPKSIKDIYSDALVKCPIDKGKDETHEWAMAMAAVSSGLCESASDMITRVMARDVTVIAFAMQPENVQADRWLARQINASIKEDTEAGKLFHKEARQDATLCRSGVRLLDKVYKTVTKSNPLKLDVAEQKRRHLILSLLADGLDFAAYTKKFGGDAKADFPEVNELVAHGMVTQSASAWTITALGLERSDAVGPWLQSAPVTEKMKEYTVR
jgi:hypothetical protein